MQEEQKYSNMMQNVKDKKKEYPDCILFYRLGDFYEMFFEDAITASQILGITLTARDCGYGNKAPMCGIPFHASDNYISKLTNAGLKVAICEQLSEAKKGSLVKRDVVRVITPGTVMDDNQLEQGKNNYIASVSAERAGIVGLAWLDLTTGEFYLQQFTGENAFEKLSDVLVSIMPSEIIADKMCCENSNNLSCVRMGVTPIFYQHKEDAFVFDIARRTMQIQLNTTDLSKFGCQNKAQAICAGGALLNYLQETQMRDLTHINSVKVVNDGYYMHLDINSRLNLEICETMYDRKKRGSLLWVIDKTKTTMGARLLRNWLEQPLQDEIEINARLDAVEELSKDLLTRAELSDALKNLQDIERLCGKVSYGNINPKNCVTLSSSLYKLPKIKGIIGKFKSKILKSCANNISNLDVLAEKLKNAIVDEPPAVLKDGGFIKKGFNVELDKYLTAQSEGRNWILELEAKERELIGVPKLKIAYNRITGYFFEIPRSANAVNLPSRFQLIQARATADRYSTLDLKKLEDIINNAEEQRLNLEIQIFNELRQDILKELVLIQQSARQIAIVDCLLSMAEVAVENDYVRPEINSNIKDYEIIKSRHPVVEKLMNSERFVPNDVLFNDEQRTIIITGPNMAGKSTYMRQIALVVLLAHIGCFVPAESAKICLTDRIFTRIGASDNLGMGQSTFMVEMSEVANIIKNATSNSLLILDEIGRGTSTQDGLSIAWAVLEYIATSIKARTLFSTHYHKLTELQGKLPGVVNMKVTVSEFDNKMSFLRKVEYGSTSQSFGLEVAKMAGIPQSIINRAREVMKTYAEVHSEVSSNVIEEYDVGDLAIRTKYEMIANILNNTDINNLTPLEALSKLSELKLKIQ